MELTMRRFLHDIIAELLVLDDSAVVWSNQDGGKQDVPLVTLTTYSHQAEAMEDRLATDEPGVLNLKTPTAFVLEVRYFGRKRTYPVDILDNLIRQLERPSVVDKCFQNGVAFLYADPVQDITTTLDNKQQFEPAAAVDIHCRYTASITDKTEYIDTVEIHGEYNPEPEPEPSPEPEPAPGDGISQLIYGHISENGVVTDLDHAIPVDLSVSDKE